MTLYLCSLCIWYINRSSYLFERFTNSSEQILYYLASLRYRNKPVYFCIFLPRNTVARYSYPMCTKIHDFILIMFKRFILGCSKCSSFVVIHVSSGVDDICTVLSNQPVPFFYWKDSHNAHPQQLQCTSLQRCARSVAQAPKLHPHYNES